MTEGRSGIVVEIIIGWAKDRGRGRKNLQESVSENRFTVLVCFTFTGSSFCVQLLAVYSVRTPCKISLNCTGSPMTSLLDLTVISMGVAHLQKSGLCAKCKCICSEEMLTTGAMVLFFVMSVPVNISPSLFSTEMFILACWMNIYTSKVFTKIGDTFR